MFLLERIQTDGSSTIMGAFDTMVLATKCTRNIDIFEIVILDEEGIYFDKLIDPIFMIAPVKYNPI